ncbi:MAG: metallopeptidase family protein [Candidatus Bipolaricaulaceae bacterium]
MLIRAGQGRFVELVQAALAELPDPFRKYLAELEVRVEDYPDDDLMAAWGLVPPDYPFGVYDGPALPEAGGLAPFPGVMVIYRRPLEQWCECEEELRDQIRRTIYHELGHRIGFPDAGMPDPLRAGASARWRPQAVRREACRHLQQAQHDWTAARLLLDGGAADWALEAALTAMDRALRAVLVSRGDAPEVLAEEGIPRLLARAAVHLPGLRDVGRVSRLWQVSTGMGDPRLPPPQGRVRARLAEEAVDLARRLLDQVLGVVNGDRQG